MADRRMFSLGVIDTDAFLSLPLGAQALYFQLAIRADDDGFVKSPKTVQKMIRASEKYMRALCDSGYVIRFDSGVVAVTHWKLMNRIKSDRYKPTLCRAEIAMLEEDQQGAYRYAPERLRFGSGPEPQVSPGEASEDQFILGEASGGEPFAGEGACADGQADGNADDPLGFVMDRAKGMEAYGKKNNVFLTRAEYAELKRLEPDIRKWIDIAGEYIASGNYGVWGHADLIHRLIRK